MNKIFKVIFSKAKGCYVVVSELAKSAGKGTSASHIQRGYKLTLAAAVLSMMMGMAPVGAAGPVDLGNNAAAAYDGKGNLTIGDAKTVAEGKNQNGENNTTIGTQTDTLRNVTEGETKKDGQPLDDDSNTVLVDEEGKAHNLNLSTEAGGSTAVGYQNKAEGDNSTAIGNNAKITNKPVTYYVDADGKKTASPENAVWYKDSSGNPTKVPQVFRDADGNTTTTPQYVHTYMEKDPDTKEDVTKTEITSDATKADKDSAGNPVYNYKKEDNTDKLYSVTLYQAASNSIAAGTYVTANGSNAVALGYKSTADNSAVAIGDTAAAKENAVAIGKDTKASAEGSIALGKGSKADRDGGVAGWDPKTGTASTKSDVAWKSGEGALSIGNGGASRQITNVAAGSEDSDAVNLAQLKNAMTHYYSVKTTAETDGKGNNNYLNDGATGDNALAAGVSAVATGDNATAVGYNTSASGSDAAAFGSGSKVTNGGVAVGSGATASGGGVAFGSTGVTASSGGMAVGMYGTNASSNSAAFGLNSTTATNSSVAVGTDGTTADNSSFAAGFTSKAGANGSSSYYGHNIAVGSNTAADNGSSAFGINATANYQSLAIGLHGNSSSAYATNQSIAVGNGTNAFNFSTAIGNQAQAGNNGSYAVALGNEASALYDQTTAIGSGAKVISPYGTALGSGTSAAYYATALGNSASANYSYATAIGSSAQATDTNATAVGNGAKANKSGATALGYSASATHDYSTAVGDGAGAHGTSATALGNGASANSAYDTAIGSGAATGGGNGTALGSDAKAQSPYATALGSSAEASFHAVAIGDATASSSYALAAGDGATAKGNNAVALGKSAAANVEDSVALGSSSTANVESGKTGLDPHTGAASTDKGTTWVSTLGAVSVGTVDSDGNATGTRQINGLAAGTKDTDAVNVAQLKAMETRINMHYYSVNSTLSGYGSNYDNTGASGTNALAAGPMASASGENAVAIGYGAQAEGKGATVIGQYGKATGRYALVFGGQQTDTTAEQADNVASGDNALSFGERTTASGINSTAFGWQTTAEEKRATAFGERTTASGANATAFGQLATASGQNSVAFGNEAVANNYGSTAFGNRTEALGEYSTTFGNSTVAAGMNTTAFGTDNVAGAVLDDNGAYTNIIYKTNSKGRVVKDTNGNPTELSREKMDARGNLAYLDGSGHTKSVTYTVPGGETHSYVLLQGTDGNTYIRDYRGNIRSATIGTDGTVTVGDTASADVTLKQATAGANGYHILSNANATVWGENSIASGEASTAFGVGSIAAAKNSLAALGGTVAASATNAAAIGSGAKATLEDSVALGSNSVTTRAKYKDLTSDAEKAAYAKGTSTGSAWEATDNAIAVGNDSTVTRQITGVAAGSLDTDAVNVAQLKAVDARHTTVSVGGEKAKADDTVVKGGNLEMTRTTSNGQANYDVSLNKDIVLGQQEENKGGSIVINSVGTFRNYDGQGHYTDYPMKEAVKIDGTTVSVVKNDGSDGGNDQRQVVMGVGQDTGGYVALYDNTGKKPTYIFNAISPGITYLKDKVTYPDDANEFGRLEYGDIYNGSTQFIATLDDGLKFSGDQGTMSAVKLNQELSVTGGVTDTNSLSTGSNIGVVSTPAVEDKQGNITQKAKLELKLNKDLTGLNTVTAGNAKIGSSPADTLKLTENGAVTEKTAPAGSYVTGLDNKDWNTTNPSYVSGRAATEDQLAAVSGTINQGLSFTTNTKDATNTTDNYNGYKVVNRKLGNTIAIKAGDADPLHHYATTNLTTAIANNGDITIEMDESPTFTEVTASSFNLSPKDNTTKDEKGYTASAQLNAHYRDGSLNPDKNVTMADGSTGMVRLHYHDGEGTIHDLATMDDGQIYAGDIKTDGTEDTTGFGRKMNQKTTINGGVKKKENLSDNNIGVVSNGTDTLTVKLAKELKDLTSVTTGKAVLNNGGITITNDVHDPNKTVAVKGDEVTFGGNQVNNMGSGADDKDDKGNPTYNILTNGANIGDVKNIAGSTTDAAKLTGDSNITVTYNDPTADGKNTVKLNDSITLGSDADKKVTIDGTAGTITAGDKVSLNGSTGIGSIGGVTIGNQTGVATTKMDGDKAKTENGTFVTGLTNTTWDPDTNGIVSGRAATEDQLKTVSDTVNAGWELDVNGTKQKAVTPTSSKVNFVQGQNISISGSGDDVIVATADDVRFTTIHVTGDKDDSGSYIGGITIGKQSGGNSANPGPGYYITGLENKSWNVSQIQSGRAATEDQLKQVAEDIKHGTVDGDKYVTGGTATYGDDGKGSAKLTGTNGLEGTIANLHDYYVTKGEVSEDGKKLTMTKNDNTTFDVDLGNIMQSDMRLVRNPASEDGKYIVDSDGNLKLTVQDANGTKATRQTITLSGLASKAEVDKGLIFAANSGTPYSAKLGDTVTVKGSAVKAGHDYSDENLTTEVDGKGNITIKMDKDLTADTMTVSGKDGKDGQIGITGKDGADGTVTTIIKTIGRNGTNGTDGTPGVNGTDGITRIVYQDGQDGDAGTTPHTVATLDDGLKFGANAPVVGKTVNPVGNKMNSTINIKGAGTKNLQDYSGKNLLTSVEQDADGTTTIHVLMDRNISADGVTVGQAGTDGVAGADGEVGQAGTIGINGKNGVKGENSKEGITTTIIRTEKGQPGENGATGKPGVDGKDITRIVYQNDQDKVDGKDGSHTVATLDDGLKFSGDDNKVITKKLNEQLQFVGGAAKGKLTENNIGINELEDGKLTIQLVNTPNLGENGNLTAGKAQIGWVPGDTLAMTKDGINPSGNKAGAGSYATGLSNTDWNVTDPEYVSGRAATEDQLAKVSKAIGNATTAAGKRTVVTVNDKSNPAEATPSATAGEYGDYDSTGGNLMIAAKKDSDGVLTYNIKLNDQLAIGQKGEPGVAGKDGKDGKVTVETKGGTTVVIGHDGEPGKDGKDGLFVTGKDGADGKSGVSITGPNGAAGTDGIDGKVGIAGKDGRDAVSIAGKNGVGHIGLTGPKGEKGKDGISIDITTDLKSATLDDGKNVETVIKDKDGKDTTITQAPRIQYDSNGKSYEVATMDDGQKYAGDFGDGASVKLNKTVTIKGNAAAGKTKDDFVDGNIAVVANKSQNGEDAELLIKLNKDLTGLNSATYTTSTKNGDVTTTSTTVVDGTGLKIDNGPSITNTGIDGGKHQITNVASGKDGKMYDTTVKGQENWNNAANIGDVTNIAKSAADGVQAKSGKNITVDDNNKINLNDHITLGDAANKAKQVDIDGNGAKITAGDGDNKVTVDGSKGQIVAGGDNGVKIGNIENGDSSLTIYDKDGNATNKKADGGNYVTNLGNKTWNADGTGSYVSGRAATEDQLHQVESNVNKQIADVNTKIDKVDKHHTEVTVNGGTPAKADGAYTDGNLQLKQTTGEDGQKVYDLKLNDQLKVGQKGDAGKGGKDGNVTVEAKGGTTVVIGHDGKDGKDGRDGLFVTGKDGKDGKSGVSITGPNGVAGRDGVDGKVGIAGKDGRDAVSIAGRDGVGHIGLTGPKGADGKDGTFTDLSTTLGQATLDPAKNVKGKDGDAKDEKASRIHYETTVATKDGEKTVSHEVATMDDGMKYGDDFGNTAKVKLNHQLDIVGDINAGKKDGDKKATKDDLSDGNIGIVATDTVYNDDGTVKGNGKMTVKLAKDLKGLNSIESNSVTTGNTTINNGGLTIKTGDANRNITVQDGNVNMGGNQIHHVAPGQAPDDAVNVSQLNATNYAVNKLDTRVNRVGANAAALAALHSLDFDPDDKWDFSAGYGHYKDANAAAVGAFYRPNEDTMFSVGGSFGGGENMVNAGVSVKLGQGNHVSTSRVAMAKEIKDLKKDVADLKAVVNQQSALIDKLTGVNAGELSGSDDLFPDVPANHWAYEYVTRLKQAGILTGYPDGNFAGDRMMTRYEFAAIVYRAIMAGAAANPSLNKDGTLDRLAKEFSSEMKYIRIDTIRKDRNGRPTIQRVRVIKEDENKA